MATGLVKRFDELAARASQETGRPRAFLAALALVVIWAATGPFFHYSDTWQLVINTGTTVVTFLMVFLIQSTQNRDTSALHAKLDELIRVTGPARNELIGVEQRTDDEITALRVVTT